jgi:exopolysaccharide biosynthesis polyprenyl glycosylphosphotransferase
VGVVGEPSVARAHQLEEVCLGTIENLDTILAEHRIDAAIVTTTGFRSQAFRNLLEVLSQAGVEPMLSTGVAHLDTARLRLGSVVHEPMVSIDWHQPGRAFTMTKRAIDIAGAAIALTVAAPVLLLVGLAIKLADRGPVLYHSARVGLEGEPFAMVKFRSMRVNAHDERNDLAQRNERSGPLFKLSNDPRVTPVGRFLRETSLDELPQLWNVLRGDMSLVGPRPSLPEEAVAFDSELQARFDIQPGVTGLWQVEARSNPNFSAYRRLDLHYLANRSLALDVKILIATVIGVLVSVILVPARFLTSDASMTSIDLTTDDRVIDLRQRLAMTDRSAELTA